MNVKNFAFIPVVLAALLLGTGVIADPKTKGPVTRLDLPRFVSLKHDTTNARRGPSRTHRIDWVYKRRHLPVQIVAEYEHWRKVRDHDGLGGWVHARLLSGNRYALFQADGQLHLQPDARSPVVATVGPLVMGELKACQKTWCKLELDGARGWAEKTALWGVDSDEVFD